MPGHKKGPERRPKRNSVPHLPTAGTGRGEVVLLSPGFKVSRTCGTTFRDPAVSSRARGGVATPGLGYPASDKSGPASSAIIDRDSSRFHGGVLHAPVWK